jgi:hypothetical protein
VALGSASSCRSYDSLASGVAHSQVDAMLVVRRDSAMAGALCHEEAVYTYLETRLILERMGGAVPLPTFPVWYDSETGGHSANAKPIAWSQYCRELDATGAIYDRAVLLVRDYALAIEGLADATAFDASGLQQLGEGASGIAQSLSATGTVVSAAQGIGSAAAKIAGYVVQVVRTHALKSIVQSSHCDVQSVLASLAAYLDALEAERHDSVARARRQLFTSLGSPRDAAGAALPAADAATAFDASIGGSSLLARYERHLAADRKLVLAVIAADDALAAAATSGDAECHAKDAAGVLARAVDDLKTARPEDP